MLKPLEQWICDNCGEVIETVDHGWIEWVRDEERRAEQFHIVHNRGVSPLLDKGRDCYFHTEHPRRADQHLHYFIGADGLVKLLSLLDIGDAIYRDGSRESRVGDVKGYTEILRRLMVPHYEEARLYFAQAREDGMFDGANEVFPYVQDTLQEIVRRYRDAEED